MSRFDELRAANPGLGFALYALDPDGLVTLEILDETGTLFTFRGVTADACMAMAFPVVETAEEPPTEDVLD